MTQLSSHLGKKIKGLKYFPVMESGCDTCLDETDVKSIEYKGEKRKKAETFASSLSKLDEVVNAMGGPNSKSGTVVMAMSGGVDSSVLPAILTKLGYKGIGVHMQFWADDKFNPADAHKFPENKCCSLESLEHAREIAHRYDMPFYVLNTRDVFKENIVDYFVDEFSSGVTPNPCIECNRAIKFGYLIQKMHELGADFLATGHYVKNEHITEVDGTTRYALKMASDKIKDQSYFLYTITQERLKHCIFPLAELSKDEIRQIAEEEGLMKVAEKKDSQGICFFPEKSHVPFLKRHMKPNISGASKPGPIKTKEGEIKGQHHGLAYYTIGQRQGLEIGGAGGPWYVIGKEPKTNTLLIGSNEDLFSHDVHAAQLSFVANVPPAEALESVDASQNSKTTVGLPILARIRHRFTPNDAVLTIDNPEDYDQKHPETIAKLKATIKYDDPQRAITPGQSIVFYKGDEVLGGGIIV